MEIDNCGYGSKPMAASDGKSAARRRGIQPPSRDALASHITGAILAGGASRRLGRDKALTPLAGKALALRVADALAPLVSSCWLITNQPLAHAALGLPLVTDLWPFQGPVGGLITALFQARTPWILAAAVDNPFPAPELLARLAFLSTETSRPAVVCRSPRGLEPFPGLYAVRLLPRLTDFLRQDRRPTRFLEVCRPLVLSEEEVGRLDPEGSSFFNLNTAAEVARATAWWMARCARESDQP
jgi:molybdopterin-guanine dinucleotide biosynthesis protein A